MMGGGVVIRKCVVCGAHLGAGQMHRHEDPDWRPLYDDFEGALEGYGTVGRPILAKICQDREAAA